MKVLSGLIYYSSVEDTGDGDLKEFTVTKDKYGPLGIGSVTASIRGSLDSFNQADVAPDWESYTVPVLRAWRYVQMKCVYAVA